MSTSIFGILLSVLSSLYNTALSPETLFLNTINRYTASLEIIWNRSIGNEVDNPKSVIGSVQATDPLRDFITQDGRFKPANTHEHMEKPKPGRASDIDVKAKDKPADMETKARLAAMFSSPADEKKLSRKERKRLEKENRVKDKEDRRAVPAAPTAQQSIPVKPSFEVPSRPASTLTGSSTAEQETGVDYSKIKDEVTDPSLIIEQPPRMSERKPEMADPFSAKPYDGVLEEVSVEELVESHPTFSDEVNEEMTSTGILKTRRAQAPQDDDDETHTGLRKKKPA